MENDSRQTSRVVRDSLPERFPTHSHTPAFWEALGRAVGAFGFLEEVLLRAIFAITATTPVAEEDAAGAYRLWVQKLERALSDQLVGLINTYGKAARLNPRSNSAVVQELLVELHAAAKLRNVICHASWRPSDSGGASKPFYVNRQGEVFESVVDIPFLDQLRSHTAGIACSVMDSVGLMGLQFPGTTAPGQVVWPQPGN